ncbi:cytochrome bd-type quinol oxidase subunit 2 [Arthrobacter pigmenti]|uniref:Cytochrome bd-type quinol oxidase subunit 2 n=1 Tax=Arthrobacter pigmenti TaxID=271432 RepID=A0A846RMN3_9MICC|nr:DUF1206 domain-containing protein [Arthrobacter pigmenti]NJC21085.1 cytochrome bd-type quinol oxidase subunit 2 [Arthrobacter pigmenti]
MADLGGHARKIADGAEEAADSKAFETAARLGFAANGLMHLVIGFIAVGIAMGGSGSADQSGAMGQLAAQPGGIFLLWFGFLGCVALALFQLSEAAFAWNGRESKEKWGRKLKAIGQAIAYAAIGVTFGIYALGGSTDSGQTTSTFTSTLMTNPAGAVLLIVLGAAVIGIGGYYVYKGAKRKFLEDLQRVPGRPWGTAVKVVGAVGYCAKGVALAVLGLLFIVATVRADPEDSTGLDGALKSLQEQPFGALVLGVIAVGLIAYGIYSIVRAPLEKM